MESELMDSSPSSLVAVDDQVTSSTAKAVASGHRMTGLPKQDVSVPTRTQREPAAYRRNSRFLPRCRAVARSRRPHQNRCHCRVTNRPRSPLPLVCWGPASHRFRSTFSYVGPQRKRSAGHPVQPQSSGLSCLSVRLTPACSLLGSDRASEHSSLTGRRGYALVSLSTGPVLARTMCKSRKPSRGGNVATKWGACAHD